MTYSLRPHQLEGVKRLQNAPLYRHILCYDPGVGKTAPTITFAHKQGFRNILITCPAVVRLHWEREFAKWAPDSKLTIGQITNKLSSTNLSKKKRAKLEEAYEANVVVTSHNLLGEFLASRRKWDLVVLDELHRFKGAENVWAKNAAELTHAFPLVPTVGLTGTIQPNDTPDLHNQIDLIYPKRVGGAWKFKNVYSNGTHNGYGWAFKGINELRAAELNMRLGFMMHRVTRAEIADSLPEFDVSVLPVSSTKKPATENFSGFFELKMPAVRDWMELATTQSSHIAVMTHLRKNAEKAAKLAENLNAAVYLLHGDTPANKRTEMLEEARQQPRAVICSTMHALGIGIDMTFCQQALLAELYYRPEIVIQALGRFSRLSSLLPSSVRIMVLAGTLDERVGLALESKLETSSKVTALGMNESMLLGQLRATPEIDWNALCKDLVTTGEEEEECFL